MGDEIDGHISDEQYLHLKNICKIFNLKTFEDFHNHYLKKYILLLAESFEKFICISLKCYNLDPCHYLSAPGLSWDAMLKMTKVKVEKISDPDKYLFLNKEWEVELVILIKDTTKHLKRQYPLFRRE